MRGGLVLTNFLLLGAGYASWDIAPKAYESINAEADTAYKVSKVFSDPTITTFKTSPDGIYDSSDSQALITTGNITVAFALDCTYLDELGYLKSDKSFSFRATLTPAKPTFVSCVKSLEANNDASVIDDSSYTGTDAYVRVVTLPIGSSSSIDMKLVYAIEESSRGYIYESKNTSIVFEAEAIKA